MKAKNWPFRPDHITNDGDQSNDLPLRKLTGEGIISNAHLQGIQTLMCANLENPTTIVEFSPSGEAVRTDSRLLFFAMHPPCRIFRECTYHGWCLRCDNRQALLFSGLGGDPDVVLQELSYRVSQSGAIREYEDDADLEFGVRCHAGRAFFAYDCPLLGYRELLFPIFFERRVVGTFFVGQLCLAYKLDFIRRKQRQLFKYHVDYFAEFLNRNPKATLKQIEENMRDAHRAWIENPAHVLSENAYVAFIQRCCNELDTLEKTLTDQMSLQRMRYVRERIDNRIEEFRSDLSAQETSRRDRESELWKSVEKCLRQMCVDFAIRYVIVFASDPLTKEPAPVLRVVVQAGTVPSDIRTCIESGLVTYNLDRLPPEIRNQWITSAMDERVFHGLEGFPFALSGQANLIRVFPIPFFRRASLVVLVGYKEENPGTSIENKADGHLSDALHSFYTVVSSALSSVLAALGEAEMLALVDAQRKALLCITHSIQRPLVDIRSGTTYIQSRKDEITPLVKKWLNYIKQTAQDAQVIAGSSARVFRVLVRGGDVERGKLWLIDPVEETRRLAKRMSLLEEGHPADWTYRNPKKLQIRFMNRAGKSEICADKDAFLFVMYNLLDNAIKYSYRGKYVDISYDNEDSALCIKVKTYGPVMPIKEGEEDSPFELFWRGEEQPNYSETDGIYRPGLGVGLWAARMLIEATGGKIWLVRRTWEDAHYSIFAAAFPLADETKARFRRWASGDEGLV